MAQVQLEGPLYAWSDTALACRVGPDDAALPMMAFLGPEHPPGTDPPSREWIGRGGSGVLPLTEVMPYGNRHIWLYPRMDDAVGLARLVEVGVSETLPTPIAARLVAEVADTLHKLGSDAWTHPGPAPQDVALDDRGQIHILGFSSPWPASPALQDPAGGTHDEALVWRLGVLLGQLIGGAVPAVFDRSAHESMVRRVLIRAMARPGPLFSERYQDWVRGMLAWDPGQRPPLRGVGAGLREVATRMGGPDLAGWAAEHVGPRAEQARAEGAPQEDPTLRDGGYQPWMTQDVPGPTSTPPRGLLRDPGITLQGIAMERVPESEAFDLDEPTVESGNLYEEHVGAVLSIEPGTIPVAVGPPAEAAAREARLPARFLDDDLPAPTMRPRTSPLMQNLLLALLGAVVVGLTSLALLVFLAV